VFDREGGLENFLRKNRNKARIKFLVKKLGIDAFRDLVEEELRAAWAQHPMDVETLADIEADGPNEAPAGLDLEPPADHETWLRTNTADQKQPGFKAVSVTVPLGNITPEQFRGLANIMRRYAGGNARTTQTQNLVLRWVYEADLASLHAELDELGFGRAGADTIQDVVSCPGADSCALAVTASMGLGRALSDYLVKWQVSDSLSDKVSVKISGCPNGCGQHHIGNIGFQGAALKVEGREVPAYDVMVGGGGLNGADRFGRRVGVRVPSKRTPEAVRKIIDVYQSERRPGEEFLTFVDRVGPEFFKPHLESFEEVGPVHKDMDQYFDWDSNVIFQVVRGEGECAA
jgi:sulfite reductase beta subunit-like hemoprotein